MNKPLCYGNIDFFGRVQCNKCLFKSNCRKLIYKKYLEEQKDGIRPAKNNK